MNKIFKNIKEYFSKRKELKFFLAIILFIVATTLTLGIGYAEVFVDLSVEGDASLDRQQGIVITNVSVASMTSGASVDITNYVGTALNTDINLTTDNSSNVRLLVTVKNTTAYNYKLNGVNYDSTGSNNGMFYSNVDIVPTLSDGSLIVTDIIKGGETKNFYVTYSYGDGYKGNAALSGLVNFNFTEVRTVYFQLPADWSSGHYVNIFLFSSTNSGVNNANWPGVLTTLTDSTKNIYSYTFAANEDYTIYDGMIFADFNDTKRQTVDISLTPALMGSVWVPELYTPTASNQIRVFSNVRSGYQPYIYMFKTVGSTTTQNKKWPGVAFTTKQTNDFYSTVIDPSAYQYMIFNNGGNGKQTNNILIDPYRTHQDISFLITGTKGETIGRRYYLGSWHNYYTWLNSEYTSWNSGDNAKFAAAKTALGYS